MTTALQILDALGSCAALFFAGVYAHQALRARRSRKRAHETAAATVEAFNRFFAHADTESDRVCDCPRCTSERKQREAEAN